MAHTRILIVENEVVIAMDLKDSLMEFGYEIVDSVMSGEESLAAAERLRPDIVLMDIKLDGKINGMNAATQISDRFSIPVVFMTGYGNISREKSVRRHSYIQKPFEVQDLRFVIEIALHKFKMENSVDRTIFVSRDRDA